MISQSRAGMLWFNGQNFSNHLYRGAHCTRGEMDYKMSMAYDYNKKYSMQQLLDMQQKIIDDPANKNTGGGIWIYKKYANKRLDAIAQAITWKLQKGE